MFSRKFLLITLLAAFAWAGVSCQTVPATSDDDIPSATYNGGIFTVLQEGEFRQIARAAEQAMENMNVRVTSKKITTVDGLIIARGPDNARISVHLQKVDPYKTQVKIRYGLRGDLENSQFIFATIDSYL